MMHQALFKPIRLGTVEIPNRIALAPMGLGFETQDEIWPERYFPFIEARCQGEAGLIITHFTNATPLATAPLVGIYDDRFIATHKRLTEVVHRYESKVFLQIAAMGGKGGDAAPSAIESPNYLQMPRELKVQEIQRIINDFASSAARARQAGYDGVELHGGHTYLVGSFMSPHTNRRQDEYGGDFERRMRFPVEIVRAIKREVGEDFPIGFKFAAHEELEGGVTPELGVEIAEKMASEGVCYLHVSSTSATLGLPSKYPSLPTIYTQRNALLPLAKMVKRAVTSIPIIAAGAIDEPSEVQEMISQGDCDMVALGRGLLADPHWVRKVRRGERIRPCIRCNVCYQQLWTMHASVVCTVNPYLTLEIQEPFPPLIQRKKVMVVGGGPGGIVAALTTAKRGHQVTLYEKDQVLGGKLIPGSRAGSKAEIGRLLDYWSQELADSPVELRLGTEVTVDMIRKEKPQALIISVGAGPSLPSIPGIESAHVITAIDAFLKPQELAGGDVVVVGGGDVGCECALFLAEKGARVTIVEALEEILTTEEVYSLKVDLLKMLKDVEIRVLTHAQVKEITTHEALIETKEGMTQKLKADWVVIATGMRSLRKVAHELAGECADVRLIGDCVKPRRIRDAVVEGDLAGRLV